RDPAAAEVQLRALLAESRDPDTRLRARILLAEALRLQWRTAEAEPEARAAVAEAQGRGDAFAEAWAVGTLGDVLLAMDQAESAVVVYARARDLWRALPEGAPANVADATGRLASALTVAGRYPEAAAAHQDALGLWTLVEGPEGGPETAR